MSKKVGRPKITLSDLPNGWADKLIELGNEGASDIEMRVEALGISKGTWERLLEEEDEFLTSVQRARDASEVWWVRHSRKELNNKDFNNKLYEINMMNRFGWNKKVEQSGELNIKQTNEVEKMSDEELLSEYNRTKNDAKD